MVQLDILSGKMAGSTYRARRFPVRIGRSQQSQLRLEEDGVWDQHVELLFQPRKGFFLKRAPNALTTINGVPVEETYLRNGDTIQLGSAKLQFWLAECQQRGLAAREWLVWLSIAAICLAQMFVIYWLLGA